MNRRSFLIATGLTGISSANRLPAARAAQIDQVDFPDRIRAGDVTFELQGAGLYYYRSLIKGLAAGLYLTDRTQPRDVLTDVAKRVEIESFWGLKGTTIAAALARPLAANVPADLLTAIQPEVDRLHAALPNVKPGDRFALTYLPGMGISLMHNGKTLAVVEGREFAPADFSIWFGAKPMDARLKRQLLGQ